MPSVMLNNERRFDARPDRIDLRDREYRPILKSLPPEYPNKSLIKKYMSRYVKEGMILDQEREGSCTGFGLGAAINYLYWRKALEEGTPAQPKVSVRMIYQLAKFYDEWPGEDYEGSSCRGAMKGWHRHGVCREDLWPYRDNTGAVAFVEPKPDWDQDAATRPLGAYYRINKDSLADMQSATFEVGVIYVSATVHAGWLRKKLRAVDGLSVIDPPSDKESGGHAFAIVGYNPIGFIVQNSWGSGWGTKGFAILPYADWIKNGMDAWVAVFGAPMFGARAAHYQAPASLSQTSSEPAQFFGLFEESQTPYQYKNKEVAPWDQDTAYQHSIVMGNNSLVLNRSITHDGALSSLKDIVYKQPANSLTGGTAKLVFYAHGGLNDEEASIARVRILGPYFKANGLYPIFFTWKTGFLESLGDIVGDVAQGIEPQGAWKDIWKSVKDKAKEAKDRAVEMACQELLVKTVWAQMKQNAQAAAYFPRPTLGETISHLMNLKKDFKNLEVHLVGHSAGSILLGYLLDLLKPNNFSVHSCTLFAPACTIQFALEHYKPAIDSNLLPKAALTFEILTDERELADSVGPYGKSLLYLVSRALEDYHKTPLLGMAKAWDGGAQNDWPTTPKNLLQNTKDWSQFWKGAPPPVQLDPTHVFDGQGQIPLAHGSFDNDVQVMTRTLERILGKKLQYPIENLRGY